jgi:hypothetical protein
MQKPKVPSVPDGEHEQEHVEWLERLAMATLGAMERLRALEEPDHRHAVLLRDLDAFYLSLRAELDQ